MINEKFYTDCLKIFSEDERLRDRVKVRRRADGAIVSNSLNSERVCRQLSVEEDDEGDNKNHWYSGTTRSP
jgi:hypothetical protein